MVGSHFIPLASTFSIETKLFEEKLSGDNELKSQVEIIRKFNFKALFKLLIIAKLELFLSNIEFILIRTVLFDRAENLNNK